MRKEVENGRTRLLFLESFAFFAWILLRIEKLSWRLCGLSMTRGVRALAFCTPLLTVVARVLQNVHFLFCIVLGVCKVIQGDVSRETRPFWRER